MIDPISVFDVLEISSATHDGSAFTARWHVPVDLPYFQGHFPGLPIFPAVGIVDATLHALRIHLKAPSLQLLEISAAKFLSPVQPEHRLILEFTRAENSAWRCEWKSEADQKVLAQIRLSCL